MKKTETILGITGNISDAKFVEERAKADTANSKRREAVLVTTREILGLFDYSQINTANDLDCIMAHAQAKIERLKLLVPKLPITL